MISEKQKMTAKIDNNEFETQNVEQLLQIDIDYTLIFENDIYKICIKASQKLNALLARTSPYMTVRKRRTILTAFIKSHFGY